MIDDHLTHFCERCHIRSNGGWCKFCDSPTTLRPTVQPVPVVTAPELVFFEGDFASLNGPPCSQEYLFRIRSVHVHGGTGQINGLLGGSWPRTGFPSSLP